MYIKTDTYDFSVPSTVKERPIEDNASEILKMRYFMKFKNDIEETRFSQLCRRVARVISANEYEYKDRFNDKSDEEFLNRVRNIDTSIYNDMMSHRFLFNSPALFSAGCGLNADNLYNDEPSEKNYKYIVNNTTPNQMMFACFTLEVPDSLDGIFDSAKEAAVISKFGGGVGANFGNLREKDALINGGICGKSSGPISFMNVWNTMGSVVVQGGKRRAALMGMMYSNHPDIEEFIDCKTKDGNLSYFNISVAIDNTFMKAVKEDLDYCLITPSDGKVIKTVKARDLWEKICLSAHKRGDPGIFFIDLANNDSLLTSPDGKYKIETTNPCGAL